MTNGSVSTGPARWQEVIERTVGGLGYDLVDVEWAARGLLRVTIDHPAPPAGAAAVQVTVDDCERVTRQLQLVLEVEGIDYQRLEVSSPGVDRPLRREADFVRFAGLDIELTLKQAFQSRKHWRGRLVQRDGGWRLELPDAGKGEQALDFGWDEVREARLVPVLDFKRGAKNKGKKARQRGASKADPASQDGGQDQ